MYVNLVKNFLHAVNQLFLICAFIIYMPDGFAEDFEPDTQVLDFSVAVPESLSGLKSGEMHKTDSEVTVEFELNQFTLETEFGEILVISNQQLVQTIAELPAIAEIAEISKAEALGQSVVEVGEATVDSTVQLVTHPIKTITNIPKGFTRMFKSTKEDVAKLKRLSSGETSAMDAINPGYEAAKRNLCKELGIDPYSRNPVLQSELNRVAPVLSIGAYSSKKMKQVLEDNKERAMLSTNEKIWNFEPHELKEEVLKELGELGVKGELVKALVENKNYTLTELFVLSESLVSVGELPGIGDFVELASLSQSVYDSLFYVDVALFFAAYHPENPLKGYTVIGLVPVGIRNDDALVVYTAADYISWTAAVAKDWGARSPELASEYSSLEIISYGVFTPVITQKISDLGWKITTLPRPG